MSVYLVEKIIKKYKSHRGATDYDSALSIPLLMTRRVVKVGKQVDINDNDNEFFVSSDISS
jgi:hypothetical protein